MRIVRYAVPIIVCIIIGVNVSSVENGTFFGILAGLYIATAIKRVDKNCKWCGKEFRGMQSLDKYCSNKCASESRRENSTRRR